MAQKKIVIVGGGFGGTKLAKALQSVANVTLIDSKEYFELNYAALRAVVEPEVSTKICINYSDCLSKAKVIVGIVTDVSDENADGGGSVTLNDGSIIDFDVLVIATGSSPHNKSSSFTKAIGESTINQRVEALSTWNQELKKSKKVVIVGGGPTGAELAGEIATDFPGVEVTLVALSSVILPSLKPKASKLAQAYLEKKRVKIILEDKVQISEALEYPIDLTTEKGKQISNVDLIFWATGLAPNSSLMKNNHSSTLDEKGYIKVEKSLRVEGTKCFFALGDVSNLKEDKMAYLAGEQSAFLAKNIKAFLKNPNSKLSEYKLHPTICMVSLGRDSGVSQLPFGVAGAWLTKTVKSKGLFIDKTRKEILA